jgi:hypothetical protein
MGLLVLQFASLMPDRKCFLCGARLYGCTAFTLARDAVAVLTRCDMRGKTIREFCGYCDLRGAMRAWVQANPHA